MAPREALNSYPDHYLTTDYYDMNAPIMDGGGAVGLFGDAGFDPGVNPTAPPNAGGDNGMMTPVPSNNNNNSNNEAANHVENDPLSITVMLPPPLKPTET